MSIEPTKPPEEPATPPNPSKKPLSDFIDGSHVLKFLRNTWIDEKNGLKKGWLGTLITAVIIGYLTYQYGKGSSDGTIKLLNTTNANLSSAIQSNLTSALTLNGQLREKDSEIQKIIGEKNKAEINENIAKSAAATWQLLAQSGNTNTPLTERLDSLINGVAKNTESLSSAFGGSIISSNLLAALESDKPYFELFINNHSVTNGSIVSIKDSRELDLKVHNLSTITADGLTIDLSTLTTIGFTNVIYGDFWRQQPANGLLMSGLISTAEVGNHWSWYDNETPHIPGNVTRSINYFRISTNMPFPIVPITIELSAARSKLQTYHIFVTF